MTAPAIVRRGQSQRSLRKTRYADVVPVMYFLVPSMCLPRAGIGETVVGATRENRDYWPEVKVRAGIR